MRNVVYDASGSFRLSRAASSRLPSSIIGSAKLVRGIDVERNPGTLEPPPMLNPSIARFRDCAGTIEDRPIPRSKPSTRPRVTWLHAVMLAAVALTSTPAYGQRAELDKVIKRRVLSNGLEVIVVENHGVPLATVEIDVKNGSFTQTPEYAGLAHMYEHMFFKANEHLPEPDQFIDRAAELGAVFNGRTDEERVAYYMTLPADSLAGGIQALADALRGPLFLKEEIDRERQVVIGEYDRNESNPFFRLQEAMGKLL